MQFDPDDIPTNASGNRPFDDVLAASVSRRNVLKGGAAGAAAFLAGGSVLASTAGPAGASTEASATGVNLGFTAIATSAEDGIQVPEGYIAQPFLAWGEPINGSSPRFNKDASNPAEHQERQIGQGHDGMWFFPLGLNRDNSRRGLMVMNHEYTLTELTFPDGVANWDAPKTRKEQAGHGVSIVEIVQKRDGQWQIRNSFRSRRITPNTQAVFSGPAAGHDLLKTNKDSTGRWPTGTLNNCGNGYTPWGTYITCEENFNGYFWEETGGEAPAISADQAANNARYGVGGRGFGYLWASTDDTFRADLDPNRPNTYGWIVEIDPYDAGAKPVKRTALGRFKHEGFAFAEGANGEAVGYMGDDQRFDYVYKFVSAKPWRDAIAAGESPLDEGTLYAAKYNDDGTGEWLALVHGNGPLTAENGFADQGEVLIKARIAADLLGATPMDRPEWTTFDRRTGDAYCTFTNNTRRTQEQIDAANPRGPNRDGHILRWNEGGDPAATTFSWEVFLIAGGRVNEETGEIDDGSTIDPEDAFGSPDGLWMDDYGILWIETDGGQPDGSNNQMLACDPETMEIKRFLVGPVDCEITGVTMTPDAKTMFINVQHPGDSGDSANPTATSTWPDGDPTGRPRPATVAIRRADGGRVGT